MAAKQEQSVVWWLNSLGAEVSPLALLVGSLAELQDGMVKLLFCHVRHFI
jgi:hypothetical protein